MLLVFFGYIQNISNYGAFHWNFSLSVNLLNSCMEKEIELRFFCQTRKLFAIMQGSGTVFFKKDFIFVTAYTAK